MITLDTSALLAFFNKADRANTVMGKTLKAERPPLIVPAAIMCESTYFIERRLGVRVLQIFLQNVEEDRFHVDCGSKDIPRIRALVRRYADLPLGFADAAVVACAERNGGRVLTLDTGLHVVAREGLLTILP